MDKYNILASLLEEEIMDDTVLIVVSIDNGVLQVTPMGGTFQNYSIEEGKEAYGLSRFLVEKSYEYGGTSVSPTGAIEFISPREKH